MFQHFERITVYFRLFLSNLQKCIKIFVVSKDKAFRSNIHESEILRKTVCKKSRFMEVIFQSVKCFFVQQSLLFEIRMTIDQIQIS